GGSHTHEFMALADIGEDTIVYTDESSYAANIEKAECTSPKERSTEEMLETEKISTPDIGTVKELADFLDTDLTLTTKTMVVKTDDGLKMIVIRGDQEVNDVKVKAYFDTEMIDMAADEEITAELNAAPGSLGPVGSPIPVYLDYQVEAMRNYPVGANETGYHLLNVNHERDFEAAGTGDFRFIKEGETVADGSGPAKFMRGIEVGQVFKLGTKYSEAMDFNVLDQNGRAKPVLMGCYGIGISRVLSAIVESHHDDKGIYWPKSVTPFDIHLITANTKDETITGTAAEIYDILSKNHRVLYDDRNERAGVKFADSELIGLPVRIVVGRGAKDGIVEVKGRLDEESAEVRITDLTSYLADNDYA